jgi:putative ABC transport system permease protein
MNLIIRNFVHILRKFRTTSILVILGLTAAFTVFLTVAIQCRYDFSYNSNFEDIDDVYLYGYHTGWDSWHSMAVIKELQEIKQRCPELIDYCGLKTGGSRDALKCSITKEDGSTMELSD